MPTPRTDRENAARYADVANKLRFDARGYHAIAAQVSADRDRLDTFAEPAANTLQRHYEQMGTALARMAEDAEELAAHYRELVDLGLSA